MSKRINIILPEKTLAVLDRVASRGDKQSLRLRLKAGYLASADENLRIAEEWFPIEEEAWQNSQPGLKTKNKK